MRMRGSAKISSCPEQSKVMQEKKKKVMERKAKEQEVMKEVENKDDQAAVDLNNDLLPGWGNLARVGEATSRQLSRLELANKK